MKDKNVGYLILGFSASLLLLILSYDYALNNIVSTACSHGSSCPMYGTLAMQKIISFTLLGIIFLIGLYFLNRKKVERLIKDKKQNKHLSPDEKEIVEHLKLNNNSLYQSELTKKLDLSKVQMTRILDKLEAKKVIERKRRGMTNIIILQ
jgi:hypothetical protein